MKQTRLRIGRSGKLVAGLVVSFGLVAAACGGDNSSSSNTTTGGGATTTASGGSASSTGSSSPASTTETPVQGGKITVRVEAEVGNPWAPANLNCDSACETRARTFYEPLMALDASDQTIKPYLLESCTPDADYKVWTLKVRPGITFTDGTPLNADVVVDNLTRGTKSPLLGPIFTSVTGIAKVDDMTVTVTSSSTWVDLCSYYASSIGYMASSKWLAAVDADPTKATQPVGTGPFIMDSFKPGESTIVKRNPNYWRGSDVGARQGAGHRRRVRLGQDHPVPLDHGPAARSATSCARAASSSTAARSPDVAARSARRIWGKEMAMIFQDPMTSLNPLMKIGEQITEPLTRPPRHVERATPTATAERLLHDVRIPEPHRRLDQYPHELSGGMRQRVMIAIALACGPTLLFADEPTTALDVTVQAQILDLLGRAARDRNMSVILVTHDLGVVAGHTDEIAVMYGGKLVERAPTRTLFANMKMPYTEALLKSIPKLERPEPHPAQRHRRPPARPRQPAARAAGSRRAAPTPASAAATRSRRWSQAERPGHDVRLLVPGRLARVPRDRQRRSDADATDATPSRQACLMAGTGKAHLRDRRRRAAARRGPRRGVPGRPHRAEGQRRVGHQPRRAARRDPRPRRRVAAAASAPPVGPSCSSPARPAARCVFEGQELTDAQRRADARGPHQHADDLPGPDLVAEPAPQGARHRDGAADDLEASAPRPSASRRSTRCSRKSGIDPARAAESQPHQFSGGQCQRISHRPRARARPDADHLRRAGVGPRRERAGPGAEPARGPQGSATA